MAAHFATDRPRALLAAFDAAILQTESKGKITTWVKSADGNFYTHVAKDWNCKAWLKPSVENGQLTFYIIKPRNANITVTVYGYYHGHLTETFMNHFDKMFTLAMGTALGTKGDLLNND